MTRPLQLENTTLIFQSSTGARFGAKPQPNESSSSRESGQTQIKAISAAQVVPSSSQQLRSQVQTNPSRSRCPDFYIQVSFLNKICRVGAFPGQGEHCRLDAIINLVFYPQRKVIRHFSVKLDTISSAHLLSTEDAQIVWEYEELIPNASYFLCFARKGFQLTRESYEATLQEMPELLVLLSKRLSSRGGRNFRVTTPMGVLQELLVHQRKGSHKIFTCPLLDCGVEFRKSCDLTIHFNVETGNKPYVCAQCSFSFRRNILLRQHQELNKCTMSGSKRDQHYISPPFLETKCLALNMREQVKKYSLENSHFKQYEVPQAEIVVKAEPSRQLLQLQVAQILKSEALLTQDITVIKGLEKLEASGATSEEIQLQKIRMSWELGVTDLLLKGNL